MRCVAEASARIVLPDNVAERVRHVSAQAADRIDRRNATIATTSMKTVAILLAPSVKADQAVSVLVVATHLATAAIAHAADPTKGQWSDLCARNAKQVTDVLAPVPTAVTLAADGLAPAEAAEAAALLGDISFS